MVGKDATVQVWFLSQIYRCISSIRDRLGFIFILKVLEMVRLSLFKLSALCLAICLPTLATLGSSSVTDSFAFALSWNK